MDDSKEQPPPYQPPESGIYPSAPPNYNYPAAGVQPTVVVQYGPPRNVPAGTSQQQQPYYVPLPAGQSQPNAQVAPGGPQVVVYVEQPLSFTAHVVLASLTLVCCCSVLGIPALVTAC